MENQPLSAQEQNDRDDSKSKRQIPTTIANSIRSLWTNQSVLCTVPILILVTVASLDNADKQLLASSFPMLEKSLHLDVKVLGYFSMFTNLSYALSLPFWGYALHTQGVAKIHLLLSGACASWGIATIGIAVAGSSIYGQAVFRAAVGVALGSILPLSQTLLVELVQDPSMRGRAFGIMGVCEKLAGTIAASSVIYVDCWQYPYYALGVFSVGMAALAKRGLDPKFILSEVRANPADNYTALSEPQLSYRQIVERIAKIPAFLCLVAQGVFGGTPWDMMSFLLLLLDWRGFSKEQIVSIQVTMGISSMFGVYVGGLLGDLGEQRMGMRGRIVVALVSVVGGIPLYGFFLYAKSYIGALLWVNLFHFVASWTPAGALRPLCAALARNPSERAQIVSMWIVLEKASGAVFGAPLVGYLTSGMLAQGKIQGTGSISHEKAQTLAFNLFGLSSFFWIICAIFWLFMGYTMRNDVGNKQSQKNFGGTLNENDDGHSIDLAPLVRSDEFLKKEP